MYYAIIQDNEKIIGKGQCPTTGTNITSVEITEEVYNLLDHYIYVNGEVVLNPNYEKEQHQKEIQEEIDEIKQLLNELDLKSIRAIRANDTAYIAQYEAQAQEYREEIQELEKELDD